MSEESSSGNSIIQSKGIPNRKRKETETVPDPSIVEEDILVHSDHSMSSHSARMTLERNLDESPFRARVTGNDGHYYGRQNIVPTPVGGLELVEEMLVPIKECYFGRRDGSRKVPFSLHFIVNLRSDSLTLFLVLVPLSTLPNWLAEFSLWAPHLNVEYHGRTKARAIIRQYEWHATRSSKPTKSYKFNVLLTTYEMVLADASYLCNVPWEVLIVDEGFHG